METNGMANGYAHEVVAESNDGMDMKRLQAEAAIGRALVAARDRIDTSRLTPDEQLDMARAIYSLMVVQTLAQQKVVDAAEKARRPAARFTHKLTKKES